MGANVQQIGKVHCPLQLSNSYLSFVQSLSDLDICPILPALDRKDVLPAIMWIIHLWWIRIAWCNQGEWVHTVWCVSLWKVRSWCKITKNCSCFNCNIKYSISLFRSDWVQWVHRDSELDDRTLALHSSFYLADTWIQSESVLARTHFVKVRQVVIIPLLQLWNIEVRHKD